MSWSWALTLTAAYAATVWLLTLRGTIRALAPRSENGWDDAVAHGLASLGLLWLALEGTGWVPFGAWWLLLPAGVLVGQRISVGWIYQVRGWRPWAILAVHGVMSGALLSFSLTLVAVVVAYLKYGWIVRDPIRLVRLLLEWLGF